MLVLVVGCVAGILVLLGLGKLRTMDTISMLAISLGSALGLGRLYFELDRTHGNVRLLGHLLMTDVPTMVGASTVMVMLDYGLFVLLSRCQSCQGTASSRIGTLLSLVLAPSIAVIIALM